jgi:SNF2 family DNA or RNA helicase
MKAIPIRELRQYQRDGVRFLASRNSALLADQMGLGKTVQTAVALSELFLSFDCHRAILIVPTSLRLNWITELEKWAPMIAVRPLMGDVEDRIATYSLPIPVIVSTYEQIRTDAHYLSHSTPFDLVILDEAQRIKNQDSSLALACKIIPRKRSWALTGTPVENKPQDFVSIFNFVCFGLLTASLPAREMKDRAQPFFLRRTKRLVLPELPPIIDTELPLQLTPAQRNAYDQLWVSRKDHLSGGGEVRVIDMIALITALKQICNYDRNTGDSTKFDALEFILEESWQNNGRIIVFSQYVSTLQWLSAKTPQYAHHIFHGGLAEDDRNSIVSDFQSPGDEPKLLYISLKAGGVGLNLGAADTVVLFDRWWNPAVENQAIERAHRFGRSTPLQVVRFLVRDTIEERIQNILTEKQELFDEYIEDFQSDFVLHKGELHRVLGISSTTKQN